ncbi:MULTISPECIES: hypothetical protein [Erysipelothrix]|uniref:Uncharacterized protein n=1 Tax=Erysipelothrix piscisicarius TaxID=2485784 RepID=A0A3S8RMC2_9FIRM|nr:MULTISPECIES: hypothetical protein [Erysipelothrix]AZK44095.1 hypothetical protein EEI45_04375 [Erysipelothrix piscisicarius]MBK2402774.1 hypothetical protein [Erysipelothrix sp. strain 2 (EsS2-6-Brazil)]MBK2404135.1 hypothetical protein [Erysipelothrix sp. strain 2 (EsS2-7-Brazil)]NBA01732.1 hypothetical protein [Erysipelothrix rhusiopathiae]
MYKYEKSNSAPLISFKSAFIIVGSILLGTIIVPAMLNQVGLNQKWIQVIVVSSITALSTSFCFFFIETNKRLSRSFWLVFLILFLVIGLISTFWIYEILYI